MRDVGLSFSLSLSLTTVNSGRKRSHTAQSKVKLTSYSCIERPPGSRGFASPVSPSPGYLYPQCADPSASLTQEHPVPKLSTEKQYFRLKCAVSTGLLVHPHLPSFPSIQIWTLPLPKQYPIPFMPSFPDAPADRGDPHPWGEADGAAEATARPVVFLLPGTQGESGKALWGYNTGRLCLNSLWAFSSLFYHLWYWSVFQMPNESK